MSYVPRQIHTKNVIALVSDIDRVVFDSFEIFQRRFDGVVVYFFNSDFKFFRRRVGIFSLCFLCCFYFLL